MDLTHAQWRKSSYSGSNGGDCVEVATNLAGAQWHKSTRSGDNGGACVEVARNLPRAVAVRDSKDPAGPALVFRAAAWRAFTGRVKAGRPGLP